ncbi:MAG: hypothetical protein ACRD7E_15780 [Bryobacteraceae bacterium]
MLHLEFRRFSGRKAGCGADGRFFELENTMERLKNASLVFCLFVVLLVIFASYFRATEVGAFFGALAGTPVLVHVFNRLAPPRRERERGRSMSAELMPKAEPPQREQVLVLRMEGPNGQR